MANIDVFNQDEEVKEKTQKLLLWISIASMVMLFGGFTSAYLVRKAEGNWLEFIFPTKLYISTGILLLSSITMNMAVNASKLNQIDKIKQYLLFTNFLAIGFVVFQILAWKDLTNGGIYFTGPSANASGSFMYVLTGMHLIHILAGMISLGYTTIQAYKEKYTAVNMLGLKLCSTFWHFLDFLWLYLLLFLLLIR
jgi:cytochrome c oxidase subunit 3